MIDTILSYSLEKVIVETIKNQCCRYRELKKQVRTLFYEPYTKTRRQYELTAAVLSGFAPDRFKAEGIEVHDLAYGRALVQPELITELAIIQIYSGGAKPLENSIVRKRCKEYNESCSHGMKFLIIQFFADKKGNLERVNVLLPDENFNIVEKKTLYETPDFALVSVG